jgi:hypothetical protein
VAQCMDVDHSVDAFLRTLKDKGLAQWRGPSLWLRCQYVQISAFPDGSNYRLNYMPAKFFIDRRDIRNAIRGRPLET